MPEETSAYSNLLEAQARFNWAIARHQALLSMQPWERRRGELDRAGLEVSEAERNLLVWKRAAAFENQKSKKPVDE